MLQFSCKILGNILWGSETGILYYFIVDKPQTNVFVAFVFFTGRVGTAASCFSGKVLENQGLWDFESGFLYQI